MEHPRAVHWWQGLHMEERSAFTAILASLRQLQVGALTRGQFNGTLPVRRLPQREHCHFLHRRQKSGRVVGLSLRRLASFLVARKGQRFKILHFLRRERLPTRVDGSPALLRKEQSPLVDALHLSFNQALLFVFVEKSAHAKALALHDAAHSWTILWWRGTECCVKLPRASQTSSPALPSLASSVPLHIRLWRRSQSATVAPFDSACANPCSASRKSGWKKSSRHACLKVSRKAQTAICLITSMSTRLLTIGTERVGNPRSQSRRCSAAGIMLHSLGADGSVTEVVCEIHRESELSLPTSLAQTCVRKKSRGE